VNRSSTIPGRNLRVPATALAKAAEILERLPAPDALKPDVPSLLHAAPEKGLSLLAAELAQPTEATP